jgi:thioredoxin-related protein
MSYHVSPIFGKTIVTMPSLDLQKIIGALFHPTWLTDYSQALSEAKSKGMRVLLAFTAYGLCGHCQHLQADVFNDAQFGWWALTENLVLCDIDFATWPWDKTHPPPSWQMNLWNQYHCTGFPTVIGLNADGTERGRLEGYPVDCGTGFAAWTQCFETAAKLNVSGP